MHNSTGKTPTYTHTHTGSAQRWVSGRVTGAFTFCERCQNGHRSDISKVGLHPVSPSHGLSSSLGFCSASVAQWGQSRMTGADSLSFFIRCSSWNVPATQADRRLPWFWCFWVWGGLRNGQSWHGRGGGAVVQMRGCHSESTTVWTWTERCGRACMSGHDSQLSKWLWQIAPLRTYRWKEDEEKRGAPLCFVVFHCPIPCSGSHPPFDGETKNWKSRWRGARLPHKHLTLPKHKPASLQKEEIDWK